MGGPIANPTPTPDSVREVILPECLGDREVSRGTPVDHNILAPIPITIRQKRQTLKYHQSPEYEDNGDLSFPLKEPGSYN